MYFVSCIVQDEKDPRAWKLSSCDGCPNFDSAKALVRKLRQEHTVLAAWIKASDRLRFFECYVDISGYVNREV